MKNINMFLSILFNQDEPVWFSKSYQGKLRAKSQDDFLYWFKHASKPSSIATQDGLIIGLNPAKAVELFRCADSVSTYRNLLIEIDDMSLSEQMALYNKSGLPISARIFSGNRSVHVIISLEEPLSSLQEYREVHEKIRIALRSKPDITANPSQCTKIPGGLRKVGENVRLQELISIGGRIPRTELDSFFARHKKRIDTAMKAKAMQKKLYADSDLAKTDYGDIINTYLATPGLNYKHWSGHVRTACPSCRANGADSTGDHLSIDATTGRFNCWARCPFPQIVAALKQLHPEISVKILRKGNR